MAWLPMLILAMHGTLGYFLFQAFKKKEEWKF